MRKNFDDWMMVKKRIHYAGVKRTFCEGEVWWCALGENIGVEINGKSATFARPILVLRKLSQFSFMGIPLTSRKHEGTWYIKFCFKSIDEYAVLSQAKTISVFRLYKKMGEVSALDLESIRLGFKTLYCM